MFNRCNQVWIFSRILLLLSYAQTARKSRHCFKDWSHRSYSFYLVVFSALRVCAIWDCNRAMFFSILLIGLIPLGCTVVCLVFF